MPVLLSRVRKNADVFCGTRQVRLLDVARDGEGGGELKVADTANRVLAARSGSNVTEPCVADKSRTQVAVLPSRLVKQCFVDAI